MNNKQGFTLGEMAITIAIVGFLAATFLPMIKNAVPNQEQMMFKKAYYLAERSVAELINDEDYYPEIEDVINQKQYFGNTVKIVSQGREYSGDTKFCELFAMRINKASEVNCTTKTFTDGSNPVGTVTTSDGVVWILPISNFSSETTAEKIYMDVNGNKKPNCFYNKSSCPKPDRFTIKVYQDGRVEADGAMEIEYLRKVNISKDSKAETDKIKADTGIK